jgi:Uncharacterized conserved protein (DUF2190)
MTLSPNQFSQTTVQGQLDLKSGGNNVVSCQVDAAQATPLVAGQAVKLATTAGGVPKVIALAANTDQPFGFVSRNLKDQNFPANAPVEIALFGSAMYMTAGGAITRGASVEVSNAAVKVVTSGGINPVSGFAFDTASNDGDLIRVYIQAPFSAVDSALTNRLQTVIVTATLAQINAGKVLIPGAVGQKITVTDYTARVVGNFATGTSIEMESTNVTPVAVSTIAEAGLTDAAILRPSSANTTLGVGFAAQLGAGDGLQVVNNGANQTAGTSVTFTITYSQA